MHLHEPSRAPSGGSERRTAPERDPLLDGVTDGILVVDGQWRLTWLNAALERLLGRPREGLLGRVLWEALGELKRCLADEYGARLHLRQARAPMKAPLPLFCGFWPEGITRYARRDVQPRVDRAFFNLAWAELEDSAV